jgi:peptidoglycan/xylan/chitin deacetylase (PgdA/CDA1 family)
VAGRLPPLVRASVGLHAAATGLVIVAPETWGWVASVVALNHAVLTGAGLWPRSQWLGPNITRLPVESAARGEIAVTLDDGPDPNVTPAVLDLLDLRGEKATFFCIARRVSAHPALAREIVARGHSVQNHSHAHRHTFSLLGPSGLARELRMAQDILVDVTGVRPSYFRAPAGLRNAFLAPVLHRIGLELVSWTRRGFDTRERDPQRVLRRLTRGIGGGDILLLHDGHAARGPRGQPVVVDVLAALLDTCRRAGLRSVTLPHSLQAGSSVLASG